MAWKVPAVILPVELKLSQFAFNWSKFVTRGGLRPVGREIMEGGGGGIVGYAA
jgi:hypothetical protein